MLVKYDKKGSRCLTPCIANHPQKIGSAKCCECKHFKGTTIKEEEHFIVCEWIEYVLEKVSKNYPEVYVRYITDDMVKKYNFKEKSMNLKNLDQHTYKQQYRFKTTMIF